MTDMLPMAAVVLIAWRIEPILGILAVAARVLWWMYRKASGER